VKIHLPDVALVVSVFIRVSLRRSAYWFFFAASRLGVTIRFPASGQCRADQEAGKSHKRRSRSVPGQYGDILIDVASETVFSALTLKSYA
jgi:hypothetical protein